MRTVPYRTPEEFAHNPSGYVHFSMAPDGLPCLTFVDAPPRAEDLLLRAASALRMKTAGTDYAGTPLQPIADQLNALIQGQFVQHVTGADGQSVEAAILPKSLKQLLGDTLFERILRAAGDTVHVGPLGSQATDLELDEDTTAHAPALEQSASDRPLQLGESCLGFPTDATGPVVVCMTHTDSGWPTFTLTRPFLVEAIAQFPNSQLVGRPGRSDEFRTGVCRTEDVADYRRQRMGDAHTDWTWVVPRGDIARCIAGVARHVQGLHATGEVHGDIKPGNMLATAGGPMAIDSLGLSEGMRSSAMTRGWAAPEQVMGLDVCFQTDQYPIGLMLLALVKGVLYGEQTSVLVPVGGTEVKRHTVLRNPHVYIDATTAPLEPDSVRPWRDLIERCLRFSPSDRFASLGDLADGLQGLADSGPPCGDIRVPLVFGTPVRGVDSNNTESPCWVVS